VKKLYLSYSVLNEYKKCPHSFFLRYVHELVPKPWDGPQSWGSPLEFGHLFHFFMERWLAGKSHEDSMAEVYEEASTLAICEVPDDANRSLAHLDTVINNLINYFDNDPEKLWTPIVMEPEVEWKIGVVGDYEVWFRSHFDGVAQLHDGRTVVLEHKTTSQSFQQFEKRLKPNDQVSSYAHAMRHHTEWEFDGVLFTAASTQRFKSKKIMEEIARGERQTVEQYYVDCPEWESDEWFLHTKNTIKKLISDLDSGIFSKEGPEPCTMYGRCKFAKICSMAPDERQNYQSKYFIKEAWKGFEIVE